MTVSQIRLDRSHDHCSGSGSTLKLGSSGPTWRITHREGVACHWDDSLMELLSTMIFAVVRAFIRQVAMKLHDRAEPSSSPVIALPGQTKKSKRREKARVWG